MIWGLLLAGALALQPLSVEVIHKQEPTRLHARHLVRRAALVIGDRHASIWVGDVDRESGELVAEQFAAQYPVPFAEAKEYFSYDEMRHGMQAIRHLLVAARGYLPTEYRAYGGDACKRVGNHMHLFKAIEKEFNIPCSLGDGRPSFALILW